MPTYSVLFTEDVPHFGTLEIEAENHEAVLEAAKKVDVPAVANYAEWQNSQCQRIVNIMDSDGVTVAEDIRLDDYFTRHGGDRERSLCDAAPDLLDALKAPDLDDAHRRILQLLERGDAGNDDIRDAAMDLCSMLDAHLEKGKSAIAKAQGNSPENADAATRWAMFAKARARAGRLNKIAVFTALSKAGITHVTVPFDGEDDQGQLEDAQAESGGATVPLPDAPLTVLIAAHGGTVRKEAMSVTRAIGQLCYDYLGQEHDGWENNEGAYGEFTFDVSTRTITLDFNARFVGSDHSHHIF